MAAPTTAFACTVHPFPSPTQHSCAYEIGPSSAKNAILFIGGLGDGPHTVPYVRAVARRLGEATDVSYSVFEIRMTSSFSGYGHSSLEKDVADIAALVGYLRSIGREKVVLFGHSTGCQDCMAFVKFAKHHDARVDGFILQGPVSDREAIAPHMDAGALKASLDLALQMQLDGREDDCMPRSHLPDFFTSPLTAYRWYSLAGQRGDDDYFSSDLDDGFLQRCWSAFEQPVLVLQSAEEEHVPSHIDAPAQLTRWKAASNSSIVQISGSIPGANHTVDDADAQKWLANIVVQFLAGLEESDDAPMETD